MRREEKNVEGGVGCGGRELCHDSVKDIQRDQSLLPSAKLNSFT